MNREEKRKKDRKANLGEKGAGRREGGIHEAKPSQATKYLSIWDFREAEKFRLDGELSAKL